MLYYRLYAPNFVSIENDKIDKRSYRTILVSDCTPTCKECVMSMMSDYF